MFRGRGNQISGGVGKKVRIRLSRAFRFQDESQGAPVGSIRCSRKCAQGGRKTVQIEDSETSALGMEAVDDAWGKVNDLVFAGQAKAGAVDEETGEVSYGFRQPKLDSDDFFAHVWSPQSGGSGKAGPSRSVGKQPSENPDNEVVPEPRTKRTKVAGDSKELRVSEEVLSEVNAILESLSSDDPDTFAKLAIAAWTKGALKIKSRLSDKLVQVYSASLSVDVVTSEGMDLLERLQDLDIKFTKGKPLVQLLNSQEDPPEQWAIELVSPMLELGVRVAAVVPQFYILVNYILLKGQRAATSPLIPPMRLLYQPPLPFGYDMAMLFPSPALALREYYYYRWRTQICIFLYIREAVFGDRLF